MGGLDDHIVRLGHRLDLGLSTWNLALQFTMQFISVNFH